MSRCESLWEDLSALPDPRADLGRRRRGLRVYALALLGSQGLFLLVLAPFLPRAAHPLVLLLALGGGGWLFFQGQVALREGGPLAPLVGAGLGAGLFFYLGVMGLLLRPLGLTLLPLGLWGFLYLLRRAEEALKGGGGPGSGP